MRYKNQQLFFNDENLYRRYLKETRGVSQIRQYNTPKFSDVTAEEIRNLKTVAHIWTTGDRYFKLASEYYGDPEMWWVIAFYNQKPTEFHLKLGDVIYIPTPLESILFYIGY